MHQVNNVFVMVRRSIYHPCGSRLDLSGIENIVDGEGNTDFTLGQLFLSPARDSSASGWPLAGQPKLTFTLMTTLIMR